MSDRLEPWRDQFIRILDKVEESNPSSTRVVMDLLSEHVGVWLINLRWLHPEIRKVEPNERLRGCLSDRGKKPQPTQAPVQWNGWYGDD